MNGKRWTLTGADIKKNAATAKYNHYLHEIIAPQNLNGLNSPSLLGNFVNDLQLNN